MELRSLKYLEAIARHGSYTMAARELGVAQPALSMAMNKLEEELGVSLLQRQSRRITPSPEAKLLIRRAERVFEELNLARQELQAASDLRIGEVRIGMPPMFGEVYFPPLVARFHAAHPGVVITAMEGSADEVRTMLNTGAIDLGMLENRRVPEGWRSVEVGVDETVLCVHREHPLSRQASITAGELDGLPMVVFERSFLQRGLLDEMCRSAGATFKIVLQSNFVHVIHEAVAAGLGAATLLRSIVDQDPRIVGLSFDPPSMFRFSLCWRSDHTISAANRAFLKTAAAQRKTPDSAKI